MEEKQENNVNIELSEEVATGVYSNLAIITHSPSEFVSDFIQMMPGVPKGKVRSRVIMTPENAKRLVEALKENDDETLSVTVAETEQSSSLKNSQEGETMTSIVNDEQQQQQQGIAVNDNNKEVNQGGNDDDKNLLIIFVT